MKLVWAKYNGPKPKYALLLILGEDGNKVYAIDSQRFSSRESRVLQVKSDYVNQLNLPYKIDWIKQNLPNASQHIHTYLQEKLDILKEWSIKGMA